MSIFHEVYEGKGGAIEEVEELIRLTDYNVDSIVKIIRNTAKIEKCTVTELIYFCMLVGAKIGNVAYIEQTNRKRLKTLLVCEARAGL